MTERRATLPTFDDLVEQARSAATRLARESEMGRISMEEMREISLVEGHVLGYMTALARVAPEAARRALPSAQSLTVDLTALSWALPDETRPGYYFGKLLNAEDFTKEQDYSRPRRSLWQRFLSAIGSGC